MNDLSCYQNRPFLSHQSRRAVYQASHIPMLFPQAMLCLGSLSFAFIPHPFPFTRFKSGEISHIALFIMAASLQLPSPTLRPSTKTHSSTCSSVYFSPSISATKFPRQRCLSIVLRLRKMQIDLTLKCLRTSEDMVEIFPSSPLVNLVKDFYEHLNKKNMKKLNELLDNSCFFEDMAYPTPFKEKQAVFHFLQELSTAMGQNVRFRIDDVYEEGKQNAGARWHLEWNERVIPFTKGCSFFCCSENATGLLIKYYSA